MRKKGARLRYKRNVLVPIEPSIKSIESTLNYTRLKKKMKKYSGEK